MDKAAVAREADAGMEELEGPSSHAATERLPWRVQENLHAPLAKLSQSTPQLRHSEQVV